MSLPVEGAGWPSKIALAVASAAIIGGGGTVLQLHRNDAAQDVRIERNTKAIEKMETLDPKLDEVIRKVDLLNQRLDIEEKNREPRN